MVSHMESDETIVNFEGSLWKVDELPDSDQVTLSEAGREETMSTSYFLPKKWLSKAVAGEQFLSFAGGENLEEGAVLVSFDDHEVTVGDVDDSGTVSLFDMEDETIYYVDEKWVGDGIEGYSPSPEE